MTKEKRQVPKRWELIREIRKARQEGQEIRGKDVDVHIAEELLKWWKSASEE